MPIQTRTEMLATGFRSVLGVKVFGPDLREIQKLAVQIEKELSGLPNTRSAFAERTVGGYFLDVLRRSTRQRRAKLLGICKMNWSSNDCWHSSDRGLIVAIAKLLRK